MNKKMIVERESGMGLSSLPDPRPFYFVLVVWGERYRNYFLEYCLPTLLAPGNIPALAGCRQSKYLIATTSDDWQAMRGTAIFRELDRYTSPEFVELPACPKERPYWMQAIIGHKLCCNLVAQCGAYRIFTSPDSMFSDGAIRRMHELALAGTQVVLKLTAPSVRTESWIAALNELGMAPPTSPRDSGQPLAFSGRQLVSAQLRSIHGEAAIQEWERPDFCGFAATPWWRVPDEEGIVICGLFWDLMLLDYAAVPRHEISILDDRGFDGDYIIRTAGKLDRPHFVRDTDEFHLVGWQSYADLPRRRLSEFGKGAGFRTSYYSSMFNDLHRALLLLPTHVHAGPVSARWPEAEGRAFRTLLTWVEPEDITETASSLPLVRAALAEANERLLSLSLPAWRRSKIGRFILFFCLAPSYVFYLRARSAAQQRLQRIWAHLTLMKKLLRRAGLVLRGDPSALSWLSWRIRKLTVELGGREFHAPRPEPPDYEK